MFLGIKGILVSVLNDDATQIEKNPHEILIGLFFFCAALEDGITKMRGCLDFTHFRL